MNHFKKIGFIEFGKVGDIIGFCLFDKLMWTNKNGWEKI